MKDNLIGAKKLKFYVSIGINIEGSDEKSVFSGNGANYS